MQIPPAWPTRWQNRRILTELLDPLGPVHAELEIPTPDRQSVDLWFTPALPWSSQTPAYQALVRRMACRPCAFEVFSCIPQQDDVLDCLCKQLLWYRTRRLRAGILFGDDED